jgi:hypothetical protein
MAASQRGHFHLWPLRIILWTHRRAPSSTIQKVLIAA